MTTISTGRAFAPASQGLHYSFEKAGLTLERQPIPWNAEAVTVEASNATPHRTVRQSELCRFKQGPAPLANFRWRRHC